MKIINVNWFNGTVGIILAEDEITKKRHYYIGTGRGNSEDRDIENILRMGAKVEPGNFINRIKIGLEKND